MLAPSERRFERLAGKAARLAAIIEAQLLVVMKLAPTRRVVHQRDQATGAAEQLRGSRGDAGSVGARRVFVAVQVKSRAMGESAALLLNKQIICT